MLVREYAIESFSLKTVRLLYFTEPWDLLAFLASNTDYTSTRTTTTSTLATRKRSTTSASTSTIARNMCHFHLLATFFCGSTMQAIEATRWSIPLVFSHSFRRYGPNID